MITRTQIEQKFPQFNWDELSDDDWNLLSEAMFNNNWAIIENLYYYYR